MKGVLASMNGSNAIEPMFGLVYLMVFVGVLAMAYYTTRWVSKGYNRTYGTQMKILDKLPLGLDRSFLMVQVGEKHYFLYQDRNGVKLLDRVEDFVPQDQEDQTPIVSFQEIIGKIRLKK